VQLLREQLFPSLFRFCLLMLVGVCSLPAAPRWASASEELSSRSAFFEGTGGWRIFNTQLGLKNDVAEGIRVGMGLGARVFLITDFSVSGADRKVGSGNATVHALRELVRVDVLDGATRPYIVTGAGAVLFDFNDAQDYATGTLTVGYGIERRFAGRGRVSLEGDIDFYRNRTVVFDSIGQEVSRTPRTTQGLGAVSLGLGFAF